VKAPYIPAKIKHRNIRDQLFSTAQKINKSHNTLRTVINPTITQRSQLRDHAVTHTTPATVLEWDLIQYKS
jgi:hypothetical protein